MSTPPDHQYRHIYCASCGHTLSVPVRCANRFCPVCMRDRLTRARFRLEAHVRAARHTGDGRFRFITLTIPNCPDLAQGFRDLVAAFRRMRGSALWRRYIAGGVFCLEATRNGVLWHPHMHIIVTGRFLDQSMLSKLWASYSGARVVDIRLVSGKAAVYYITDYLTKGIDSCDYAVEMSVALKGYRLYQPFGSWYGTAPAPAKHPYHCPSCHDSNWMPDYLLDSKRHRSRDWQPSDRP